MPFSILHDDSDRRVFGQLRDFSVHGSEAHAVLERAVEKLPRAAHRSCWEVFA